jgi:hypothetical protein
MQRQRTPQPAFDRGGHCHELFFSAAAKICIEIEGWLDAILFVIAIFAAGGSFRVGIVRLALFAPFIRGAVAKW